MVNVFFSSPYIESAWKIVSRWGYEFDDENPTLGLPVMHWGCENNTKTSILLVNLQLSAVIYDLRLSWVLSVI